MSIAMIHLGSIDPTARKSIKPIDDIFHCFCLDEKDRKKCRELDPLFTVIRQQDEAALAKIRSTSRLLSLSC